MAAGEFAHHERMAGYLAFMQKSPKPGLTPSENAQPKRRCQRAPCRAAVFRRGMGLNDFSEPPNSAKRLLLSSASKASNPAFTKAVFFGDSGQDLNLLQKLVFDIQGSTHMHMYAPIMHMCQVQYMAKLTPADSPTPVPSPTIPGARESVEPLIGPISVMRTGLTPQNSRIVFFMVLCPGRPSTQR